MKIKVVIGVCLFLLLFLACYKSFAQDCYNCDIDSLYKQVDYKKSDIEKIKLLELVVLNYSSFENKEKLISIINRLITLKLKTNSTNTTTYVALKEAIENYQRKKFQQALNKFKLAISGFDKEKKDINHILMTVRLVYNNLDRQEEKFQFFTEKLNYYLINGPNSNTGACYYSVGGYFNNRGNYDQSISYYLKAAEVFKKYNYDYYLNDMIVSGDQYMEWGNFDKALFYLNKYLPIIRKRRIASQIVYPLMALSKISLKHKEYKKALAYADEAINNYKDSMVDRAYAIATLQKAIIYLSQHKTEDAYKLLIKSKSISDTVGNGNRLTNQNGNLETDFTWYFYYQEINNKQNAEIALLNAYKKAIDEKSNRYQLKYLRELSRWFASQNKNTTAKFYLDKYFDLNDSMQIEQNKSNIAHYENVQKEHIQEEKINNLRQEKAIQTAVINKSRIILIVSMSALFILFGAIFLIYRQLQVNKKTLANLKATQTQLIQSEKMASLGELTAGIAHEIQNPLNFVNNFSEVNMEMIDELEDELKSGNIEDALSIAADIKQNEEKINHHGKRADAIVKGMLEHSRVGNGSKEATDINKLADEYLRLSYHGLRAKDKSFNASIVTNLDENLPLINIIPQDIGRVLLNLFNNAFYAVNQKVKTADLNYQPEVIVTTFAENGKVIIKVKDNGIGIPDAIKDKIMQPFFTTKPTGEGTGLGLSLTYDMVVKGHGGKIELNSTVGEGSEFIVTLPINI